MDILSQYAGGLPVLAHEIGDAAFSIDADGRIDRQDAIEAVLDAADVVGHKHLEPQVFRSIRSRRYRGILRKISQESPSARFARAELRERLTREETKVLDNFLRKMVELGVVVRDPEAGPGSYRFSTELHSVYFHLEAERARESRE